MASKALSSAAVPAFIVWLTCIHFSRDVTGATKTLQRTMSCRVAWIMARLAVLIVLNSPAPIKAEQLRANLTIYCENELCLRHALQLYARQSIVRICNSSLSDEQGTPGIAQCLELLRSCSLRHLRSKIRSCITSHSKSYETEGN
jgi:hypothetical protein